MNVKLLEVRDRGTFIPVIAILMQSNANQSEPYNAELYLLSRAGYGSHNASPCVLVSKLDGGEACYDPYGWKCGIARTMPEAHNFITNNWSEIKTGDVIDVEFILGESTTKKVSERIE